MKNNRFACHLVVYKILNQICRRMFFIDLKIEKQNAQLYFVMYKAGCVFYLLIFSVLCG
jgi:hypothetical protein